MQRDHKKSTWLKGMMLTAVLAAGIFMNISSVSAATGNWDGAQKAVVNAYKKYKTSVDVSAYNLNYATEYNAQDEVTVAFQEILNVLSQKYGLSQEEAQEIADISNNVEYTQRVMTVLQKLGLESWDMPQIVEDATPSNDGEEAAELPDPLPEEKEIQQ